MNRRDALGRVALLWAELIGAEFSCPAYHPPEKNIGGAGTNFSMMMSLFSTRGAETILPATDSPGAKEAKVGDS